MNNIVINAQRMFDGQIITKNTSVLIANGIIAKIGKPGDFKGKVINTKFLAPGLIDMHIHLSTYGGMYSKSIKLFDYLNKMLLYNGITTVRDTGNFVNNIYNFEQNRNYRPSVISSIFLDGDKPIWGMSFIVKERNQVKEIINVFRHFGIRWVKAYKGIKPEILKSIINEAHSKGLRVAGDLLATGQEAASRMKIDTLEHIALVINGIDGKTSDSLNDIYKQWTTIDINSVVGQNS